MPRRVSKGTNGLCAAIVASRAVIARRIRSIPVARTAQRGTRTTPFAALPAVSKTLAPRLPARTTEIVRSGGLGRCRVLLQTFGDKRFHFGPRF